MSFLSTLLSSLKPLLYLGFIAPFQSADRLKIYIAAFLADFVIVGSQVYIAFDLYSFGLEAILFYFAARFFLTNLIWIPSLFYAFEKLPIKALASIFLGCKLIGLCFFLIYSQDL